MRRLHEIAPALAMAVLTACAPSPPEIVGDLSLEMNPSGRVPLAGLLTFTTDQPARATLTIGDREKSLTVTPKGAFETRHELMVLGLRPGRVNTIEISLENESGQVSTPPALEVETPALPEDFPPIAVSLSRPALMEPGYTFLPINSAGSPGGGKLAAIDAQGEVVWWMAREYADQLRLENGNLLVFYDAVRQTMAEMDMLGNVVRRWHAANIRSDAPEDSIAIGIDTIHHEVLRLPSGNFLTLSSEARLFEDYPTSAIDPDAPREPRTIIGDVIVEFRENGSVVRQWRLMDLIDPYRLGYFSLDTGYYSQIYAEVLEEPAPDWSHGNALIYLEDSDSILLSIRHQHAVAKINLGEGRLEWLFGDPTGWRVPWRNLLLEPVGPIEWFSGQHAIELTPSGSILMYDNGSWGRAIPPNPQLPLGQKYSRAVEFEIDEVNRTIRQVWSYGDLENNRFFASFLGDVDRLPRTGNILVLTGAQTIGADGQLSTLDDNEDDRPMTIITEVTHTEPPEKVWEVTIDDPAQGWTTYRAERMPGLYPNPI